MTDKEDNIIETDEETYFFKIQEGINEIEKCEIDKNINYILDGDLEKALIKNKCYQCLRELVSNVEQINIESYFNYTSFVPSKLYPQYNCATVVLKSDLQQFIKKTQNIMLFGGGFSYSFYLYLSSKNNFYIVYRNTWNGKIGFYETTLVDFCSSVQIH